MIRPLLIFSFTILTMTLSSAQTDYDSLILGNWNSCSRDGRYIEFYFSENILEIADNDYYPSTPHDYYIKHDTLTILFFRDSTNISNWRIVVKSTKEICLIYLSDSDDYSNFTRLTRIEEYIKLPPKFKSLKQQLKWYDKYFTPYYKKRWENKNCEDIRRMDEIRNDTIHILEMDSSLELELNSQRSKK